MKYLIGIFLACCAISCNKEDSSHNAAILIKVGSPDDLLSNTIVTVKSDTLLSGALNIERQSPCGADDAVYFKSLPEGWYHLEALGYSESRKRHLRGDTLFPVVYRAGQNYYEIHLFMK